MDLHNCIRIGENEVINLADFNPNDEMYNMDADLKPSEELWLYLETACLSACCGIDAFEFEPEKIEKAKTKASNPHIKQTLIDLKNKLTNINQNVVESSYLNQLFAKDSFIQLLNHLIKNL